MSAYNLHLSSNVPSNWKYRDNNKWIVYTMFMNDNNIIIIGLL